MKVLHVIPSVSKKHGGPSYAVKALVEASRCVGIQSVIATTDDDGDDARLAVVPGALIEGEGFAHIFFRRDFLPYKISFGLRRWLNRRVDDFDLVHIHALFSFSSLVAARAAMRQRVPYIIRPLGVLNRWGLENRRPFLKRLWLRTVELPILRGAAAIHYTTEAERAEASTIHSDLGQIPSFVIPIPVDAPSAAVGEQDFFQRFPVALGKQVILFMSRVDPKKNVETLLQAFVSVRRSEPKSLLVIAGDGERPYVESLHRMADELAITSDVLWTGFLGPAEKAAALAAATVFVLPSYSENFGIAAAEALAAGVACVLSDQVALTENVEQGISAIIVPCTAAALAQAVGKLLSQPEERKQIGERGREAAAQYFSSKAVGEMLLGQYQSVLTART